MPRTQKEINWNVSPEDLRKITAIVMRASSMLNLDSFGSSRIQLSMDLTACHLNGNPLDLDGLVKADESNFQHDILGIIRHLDRTSGELQDCFSPRYSKW